MTAQIEELSDSRVRLTVEVPGRDVKHAVEHAASDLAENVKIPGFRKGKVPMPVLIARVGKERLYTEAVESHIGGWFWNAAARSRIRPVAQPEYEFALPASDRQDWRFTATVDVQPLPEVADWTALEVPRAEAQVPEEAIEQELTVLRSAVAELAPVEGRPAREGDTVVVDLVNPSGETQHDYVVEVGSGRLVEEIERGLVGMSPGERKAIEFELGDDASANVEVVLDEIAEKVLPPLDDDLARAASEFETLRELRDDIEAELREQLEGMVEGAFRAAVVDRLVEATKLEAAGPLVEARTRELLNGLVRSVESRGIAFDTYLQLTGTAPEALVERLRGEARQAVGRELVLEAVAQRLGIEVPDEEVEALVREQAEAAGDDPDATVQSIRAESPDTFEQLREDLRLRDALDRVAAEVTTISPELASARERLWTPEQEKTPTDTKLWTPGSKEPA
ncbi:MAG: trigger factor [Actinobacteria bacterium]|nr:trigger factor [Actinomycetota bacterium]